MFNEETDFGLKMEKKAYVAEISSGNFHPVEKFLSECNGDFSSFFNKLRDEYFKDDLAKIYFYGPKDKRDIKKAIQYFTLAANNNDVEAQFDAGVAYYKGKHIPKDIILN